MENTNRLPVIDFRIFITIMGIFLFSIQLNAQTLPPPAQNLGMPYTTSARPQAIAKIKNYIAVFAGSRYAWVKGYKVRLDEVNWRDEAFGKGGIIYVPAAFAGILMLKEIKPDVAPAYLVDKWVYSLERPKVSLENVRKIDVDGRTYFAFADFAKANGLKVFENPKGLAIAGSDLIKFSDKEKPLLLSVITQFDSPEKLADPDIATQYIPSLQLQGTWTDHVKVTPEQMKILEGPETKWTTTPESQYDYRGFNSKLLGSKVPAPGIYPRILFNMEDVPMLAERIQKSKVALKSLIEVEYLLKKNWWDPTTSDGQIFKKLASGDLAGLEWPEVPDGSPATSVSQQFKGQKPGIYNSHIAYVPECLTDMALYCLLTNDDVHGRQAAAAIANYFKLREPLIDEWNAASDSEFGTSYKRPDGKTANVEGNGANTQWRNIHGIVAQMNLGLALDFSGKWMTSQEKDLMRRVIAKATYGRRAYGQDGPIRFRDINWVAWDLPNFLALAAIEGLEGFDKEAYQSNCETVRAFCEWGIDNSGVIYESNGKTPGGMQFQTLSMIALARRGENLWGHPHVRKLLQGQIQMTSPNGQVIVNSGTQYVPFSQQTFSLQLVDEYKAFFPNDLSADYLLSQSGNELPEEFDAVKYRETVATIQRLRMPSPMYPGFVNSLLYDADYKFTTRADLKLPLNFNAPVHGVFSSYSDASTDATWINMMVRPDHYLGAGHHHADAGMIHFSALGVNWFTESPFPQVYDGKYHNQVLVDGESEPEGSSGVGNGYQAAAKYLGAESNAEGGFASADLTNSYSYRWQTQPGPIWGDKVQALKWELDPSPENLKMFAGTAHYKMRPWWATYTYSNYIATSRSLFNPMQFVYRTVGLVRGQHPYGVVIDDLKKDNQNHLFQWTAMLNGGVWQADVPGLSQGQVALAYRKTESGQNVPKTLITPQKGEPLLLLCTLGLQQKSDASLPLMQVSTENGVADKQGKAQPYDRISINVKAKDVSYKVLLVPFRYGDLLPKITYNAAKGNVIIQYENQSDEISFTSTSDNRTRLKVTRGGNELIIYK